MMVKAFFLNSRNLFLSSVLKEIQFFFLLRVKYSIVVVSFLRKIRKTKQKLVSFLGLFDCQQEWLQYFKFHSISRPKIAFLSQGYK